jgi:ribonuclease III
MRVKRDLAGLQERIGHIFASPALLERALTHVSAVTGQNVRLQSYQRLEFLGDRVLGLVIAAELMAAFPEAEEGELSRRLSELVRKETCAEVAAAWDVGPNLKLGAGEAITGGRRKNTILGDACEALIGAAYADAGLEAARAVVLSGWRNRIAAAPPDRRDAKTALQEKVQGEGHPVPSYRELSRSGPDHKLSFVVSVTVAGLGTATGAGHSKREAEQAAARAFLDGDMTAASGQDTE